MQQNQKCKACAHDIIKKGISWLHYSFFKDEPFIAPQLTEKCRQPDCKCETVKSERSKKDNEI